MLDFIKSKARWITSLTIPTLGTQDEQERLLRSEDNIDSLVTDEPVDNCNIVYWIFFLYGVAMLLPWNGNTFYNVMLPLMCLILICYYHYHSKYLLQHPNTSLPGFLALIMKKPSKAISQPISLSPTWLFSSISCGDNHLLMRSR
ncbi:hypothetical protein BCR42DRAFT_67976 [Absidia repens]|uniref:Uncharacterized protein n=1 Tax=Absidia repens TaxID=90262 RepID=A0A1X2IC25_9FUNG|nr:hypothetical protein BCR42DRAFT_67976 [Absidia repens]